MVNLKIGTRKLQRVNGAFSLNVPVYVVRTLGLHRGDVMGVTITDDGALRIEREHNPGVGADMLGSVTPTPGAQRTHRSMVANESEP